MNMARGMKATFAVVVFAAGMGVGTPSALATTFCPPSISGTTVHDNVVVPPGATCVILDSTITGNVVVQAGASITLVGAIIRGNFVSQGAHDIRMGNCREFGCAVSQRTVVRGNLVITGTTGVPTVPSKNVICDTTIGGANVVLQDNSAPFALGGDPQCAFGDGDKIAASLVIVDNTAAIALQGNQVGGALYCAGNVPAPGNGGGNSAVGGKFGQCSAF